LKIEKCKLKQAARIHFAFFILQFQIFDLRFLISNLTMNDARSAYLETQIKTAPPPKLRLMLIEAALRLAQQAKAAAEGESFSDRLSRSRDMVVELLAGIRPEPHPLNNAARSLYAFVFQSLAEAQLLKDLRKVDDAIRVLEEERVTWQKVCEITAEVTTTSETSEERFSLDA